MLSDCFRSDFPSQIGDSPRDFTYFFSNYSYNFYLEGLLKDQSLNVVRVGKYSTQIPLADGSFAANLSDQQIVVFILGVKSSQ
jgi:hypothetical protein